jgi:hypothetical protein
MKTMRKGNDEIYQLAKDQALVKKLKNNKRFRPFVTRGSKNSENQRQKRESYLTLNYLAFQSFNFERTW